MIWIVLIIGLVPVFAADCFPVAADRISGRDLKLASAEFKEVPDDAFVTFSPSPGMRRLLSARELGRFGSAGREICFERSTQLISRDVIEAALRKAIAGQEVELEIVDYSRVALPAGTLEFTLTGLLRPPASNPAAPVLWRGRLLYEGGRSSAAVWASVRISHERQWVESVEKLVPGQAVKAEQVILKSGRQFPMGPMPGADLSAIIGRRPRHPIPAGQVLSPAMFDEAPVILKGDTVVVEVKSGDVLLRFEARAEADGKLNDSILVLDPRNNRRLKTKITDKGKVIIDAKPNSARNDVRAVSGGPTSGE
jgi:flagella basal body P-ring formation protein FlgA